MFTQRHFIALAATLKASRPLRENQHAPQTAKTMYLGRLAQWEEMVRSMADLCAGHNERFDRGLFLRAAGYGEQIAA